VVPGGVPVEVHPQGVSTKRASPQDKPCPTSTPEDEEGGKGQGGMKGGPGGGRRRGPPLGRLVGEGRLRGGSWQLVPVSWLLPVVGGGGLLDRVLCAPAGRRRMCCGCSGCRTPPSWKHRGVSSWRGVQQLQTPLPEPGDGQ